MPGPIEHIPRKDPTMFYGILKGLSDKEITVEFPYEHHYENAKKVAKELELNLEDHKSNSIQPLKIKFFWTSEQFRDFCIQQKGEKPCPMPHSKAHPMAD